MDTLMTLVKLLIVVAVIFGIFYGIWKLNIKMTSKRAKKLDDATLLKLYKGSSKNTRLIMSIISALFFGLFAIYFYYMFKKTHSIYHDELVARQVAFEPME